jgi:pimeloyl-ACP methyl ester carboxylesterase
MFQIHEYSGADGNPLRYGKLTNPNQPTQGGKAMLFVPGLGGSVKGALSFLEQLLPEYSPIYGPDLRGFGLNLLETDPLTSAKIVSKEFRGVLPAGDCTTAA